MGLISLILPCASTPSRFVTIVAIDVDVAAPRMEKADSQEPGSGIVLTPYTTRGRPRQHRSPEVWEEEGEEGDPCQIRYPSRRLPPFCLTLARETAAETKRPNHRI